MQRVLIHTSDEAARDVAERNAGEILQSARLAVSTPRSATERICEGTESQKDVCS